jgi:hypothetical protein
MKTEVVPSNNEPYSKSGCYCNEESEWPQRIKRFLRANLDQVS